MAYVRIKRIKHSLYGYLVESVWEGGKPRQKVIAYLGRVSDRLDAISKAKQKAKQLE